MGSGANTGKSVVVEHCADEHREDMMIKTWKVMHRFPFEKVSKCWAISSTRQVKFKNVWKQGCKVQTKRGGGM